MTSFYRLWLAGLLCGLGFSVTAQTHVDVFTNFGDFRLELRDDLVPITAGNFIDLADTGFYDGVCFHRIIDGFMIQGGDPTCTGTGGPGYTIPDEFHPQMLHDSAGVISMANAGPNTGGSQFFITLDSTRWLDNKHAVFGYVISGMQVVFDIGATQTDINDRPVNDVIMDSVRVVQPIDTTAAGVIAPVARVSLPDLSAFPNPFTDHTTIRIHLDEVADVRVDILDVHGKMVEALFNGQLTAGTYFVDWDGQQQTGQAVARGVYFYRMVTDSGVLTGRLVK